MLSSGGTILLYVSSSRTLSEVAASKEVPPSLQSCSDSGLLGFTGSLVWTERRGTSGRPSDTFPFSYIQKTLVVSVFTQVDDSLVQFGSQKERINTGFTLRILEYNLIPFPFIIPNLRLVCQLYP